jgi:hypothetical protein
VATVSSRCWYRTSQTVTTYFSSPKGDPRQLRRNSTSAVVSPTLRIVGTMQTSVEHRTTGRLLEGPAVDDDDRI